jgi:hypothetical protein
MTTSQEDGTAGLYAAAFAGYVRWLAPQLEQVRRDMPARLAALREEATGCGQHRRTPAIVADLAFGLELFARFAVATKALTEKQAEAFRTRCWKALGESAAAQAALQARGESARRFLELLGAAITAVKAHVDGPDGKPPANPTTLGWRDDGIGGPELSPSSAFPAGLLGRFQAALVAHGYHVTVDDRRSEEKLHVNEVQYRESFGEARAFLRAVRAPTSPPTWTCPCSRLTSTRPSAPRWRS